MLIYVYLKTWRIQKLYTIFPNSVKYVDFEGFQRSVCHFRENMASEIYAEVLLQYG